MNDTKYQAVFQELEEAISQAERLHGDWYASLHEAYAVLIEEVDEVWDEIRKKSHQRDLNAVRRELIQVAAVSIKAAMGIHLP